MKKIYIPSNLDLQNILPEYSESDLDKFHCLIHLIYEQRILYKNPEEFIPLKAGYLRSIIVRDYNYYRDILIDKNIIECDGRYIKGKKSFGYKLCPPYSEVKHRQILLKNKLIIKNLEKWKLRRLPKTDVHIHLYKFLRQLKIDGLNAAESITDLNVIEFNYAELAINKFLDKDFFLVSDDYGRVHTNVSLLKGSLRKFLRYEGKKLFNVDIVNSQPLILLLIPILSNTIRCTFSSCPPEQLDIFKYKELVENGQLYDYLISNQGFDDYLVEQNKEYDKNKFKETFFREIFFGRKVSGLFWELFPSVANIIANIKKDDYRSLAWMMQRAESDLIINKVCRRLMVEHPKCFISTIHDSILTTEENVDKIKIVMLEEFKKLGLLPSIRIEPA